MLAQSVQQMAKALNSFLFADRRSGGSLGGPRSRGTPGKEAELRVKSDGEWQRLELLTRNKLSEIQSARLEQAQQYGGDKLVSQIQSAYTEEQIDKQIAQAF